MPPLKVIQVIPSLKKGGAERLTLDLCRELQRHEEIKVQVVLLHPENEFQFLSAPLNLVHCPSFFRYHVLGKNEFDFDDYKRIIESFRPDIIHSHLFEAEFFTRNCLIPGVVYFTHLHDNLPQFENFNLGMPFNKNRITDWLEKRMLMEQYKSCKNFFIANSEDTAEAVRKTLPQSLKKRLTVVLNGIDLDGFSFVKRQFPAEEIQLISTGSLVEKKNHSFLLDVMKVMKDSGHKIHLRILGDGPLKEMLQKKIDQSGLKNEVELCGNVDDVAGYLNRAHVYLHPATYEPFGLAIVEAMATGLPVVCLDGRGNRGLIDNGVNGFIFQGENPELFASKITDILRDEVTYLHFSEQARRKAEIFSIKNCAHQIVNLYTSALEMNPS